MTKESPKTPKPNGPVLLITLGDLLHRYSFPKNEHGLLSRTLSDEEEKELRSQIEQLDLQIAENVVYDRSQRLLRAVLGVRGDECVEPLLVRIVAYISWQSLVETRSIWVSRTSLAASLGDFELMIKCRYLIRQQIAKGGAITYSDNTGSWGDGDLRPGKKLVQYLSGVNKLPIIWDGESLEQDSAKYKRQQAEFKASRSNKNIQRLQSAPKSSGEKVTPFSAKDIYSKLTNTVIGMDEVVRRFSVQMAMHLKRVELAEANKPISSPPVVTLLIGESGTGKTFLGEEAGRILGVPFAIGNMAEVTASAYVGSSVDEMFLGFRKKDTSLQDVQKGLLLLDEVDKKASNERNGDFDAVGKGVQYELLRILEGTKVRLGGRRSNDVVHGTIDTYGMGFILGGAFSGISEVIHQKQRTPVGFSCSSDGLSIAPDVREALSDYFIPEFLNRIGSIITIPPPSGEQLRQILLADTGLLRRHNHFLESFGLEISLADQAIGEMISWSKETKTYARGLRSLLGSLSEEALFSEAKGTVRISAEDVHRAISGTQMSMSDSVT